MKYTFISLLYAFPSCFPECFFCKRSVQEHFLCINSAVTDRCVQYSFKNIFLKTLQVSFPHPLICRSLAFQTGWMRQNVFACRYLSRVVSVLFVKKKKKNFTCNNTHLKINLFSKYIEVNSKISLYIFKLSPCIFSP